MMGEMLCCRSWTLMHEKHENMEVFYFEALEGGGLKYAISL